MLMSFSLDDYSLHFYKWHSFLHVQYTEFFCLLHKTQKWKAPSFQQVLKSPQVHGLAQG